MKVEIKPLVWDKEITAVGLGGHYVAQRDYASGLYVVNLWGANDVPRWTSGDFENLESAIAKANKHHEKCVFRLITVKP